MAPFYSIFHGGGSRQKTPGFSAKNLFQSHQVPEDGPNTAQTVVALSIGPLSNSNRDLGDAAALQMDQSRNKAMEPIHETKSLRCFGAIGPERRTEVVHTHAGHPSQDPIRDQGRNDPKWPVHALLPLATDKVISFFQRSDKKRQVFREMLKIRVERDQDLATRVVESRLKGEGFAMRTVQFDNPESWIFPHDLKHVLQTSVKTAVIDPNKLHVVSAPQTPGCL